MSVSFMWEIIKPGKAKSFAAGTSSDIDPLRRIFGDTVETKDIPTLRAMHAATHCDTSLWSEIADTLERLDDEDAKLKIWTEF